MDCERSGEILRWELEVLHKGVWHELFVACAVYVIITC